MKKIKVKVDVEVAVLENGIVLASTSRESGHGEEFDITYKATEFKNSMNSSAERIDILQAAEAYLLNALENALEIDEIEVNALAVQSG